MAVAKRNWAGLLIVATMAALVLGGLAVRYLNIHRQRIADAKAWGAIDGPPCPQITEAELLKAHGGLRRFEYGEVIFARHKGQVECATVYFDGGRADTSYPVCQFDRPGTLKVSTARGEWRFHPGPGHAATVSAPHGQARCVLATAKAPA